MQFHNRLVNNEEALMTNSENIKVKGLLQPSEYSEDLFKKNQIKELREKVSKIKSQEPAKISYQDQINFWSFLTDTQIGKFEPEKLTKPNTWVITANGTWLVQKNKSGYYGIKKTDVGIPTLPKTDPLPVAFLDLTYGKIPNAILEKIVAFFKEIMKRYNDAEAFIQIYWDKEESKYVCHVPKQQVSKGSVRYDTSENLDVPNRERYVFVYECHSHNSMGAFFSGTDNRDEKELRLYGVFGRLDNDEYENKHRFFVGEEEVDCDINLIFDIPKEEKEEKKYLVIHNKQQYMVDSKQLILDEKPKYILEHKGQKFYVPLESVSLFKESKPQVEYPESWFQNINVPIVRETVSTFKERPVGRNWDGDNFEMPKFADKKKDKSKNPFYFNQERADEPEVDEDYELMVYEVSSATKELLMMTANFEDPEATFAFIEAIEEEYCLKDLEGAIASYYHRSRQIEQGPSDGRY